MADNKLEVRILTPEVQQTISQYKYQGEADMVIVRTVTGDRGFLYGHESCSVVLDAGITRIIGAAEEDLRLAVIGGIAQVEDNIITIITETANWPEDIDRARATAKRDEVQNLIDKAESVDIETLKKELRAAEVLITVSGFPPSGAVRDK